MLLKNTILLFLGNHFSHNFTIHIDKQLLCTIRGMISLCSSLNQSETANNTTYVGHVFILCL